MARGELIDNIDSGNSSERKLDSIKCEIMWLQPHLAVTWGPAIPDRCGGERSD